MNRGKNVLLVWLLLAALLSGCGAGAQTGSADEEETAVQEETLPETEETQIAEEAYTDQVVLEEVDLEDEAVALAEAPAAVSSMLLPTASGTLVKTSDKAEIDYSNTADGYVMVRYKASTTKRLKAQVKGPTTTYTYNLTAGKVGDVPPFGWKRQLSGGGV